MKKRNRILSVFINITIIFTLLATLVLNPMPVGAVSKVINFDSPYSDYLSTYLSTNEYLFSTTKQGYISITLLVPMESTLNSWRVSVYDLATSTTLMTNDYGSTGTPTSLNAAYKQITINSIKLPISTFYISVSCPSQTVFSYASYSLSIKYTNDTDGTYEVESNDTTSYASFMEPNKDIKGILSTKSDIDCFKVTLPSFGSARISFSISSSYDNGSFILILCDKNEKQLLQKRVGTGGTVENAIRKNVTDLQRLPAGLYYIKIMPYSEATYINAEYMINLNFTAETTSRYEKEFNDSRETSTKLQLNGSIIGNLSNSDDVDYYEVHTGEFSDIRIKFEMPEAVTQNMWTIYVADAQSGIMTYNVGQGGTVLNGKKTFISEQLNLSSGIYYIAVYSFSSSSFANDDYILTVHSDRAPVPSITDDSNANHTTEIPLLSHGVNTGYQGQIKNATDSQTFTFGLASNGSVNIGFQIALSDAKQAWNVDLFDQNNNLIQANKCGDTGTDISGYKLKNTDTVRLPAGTYYVKVTPISAYNFSTATYTTRINYIDESTVNLLNINNPFEKEYNNSIYYANEMKLTDTFTGNMSSPTDNDYYKITLENNTKLSVEFQTLKTEKQNNWVLKFYSADNKIVFEKTIGAEGVDSVTTTDYKKWTSSNIRLPKGSYYIGISPYSTLNYSNSDYKLNINAEIETADIYEREFNDTLITSNPISVNGEKIGNLSSETDIDSFKFSIKEIRTLQFKLSFDMLITTNVWYLNIYDSNGNMLKHYPCGEVASLNPNGEKYIKTEKIPLVPGDYYITMNAYSVTDKIYSNTDYTIRILDEIGQISESIAYKYDAPATWADEEVRLAYAYGLVPNAYMKDFSISISREDFCILCVNFLTKIENKTIEEILASKGRTISYDTFTDTQDYSILAAYELGIVNGKGQGIFAPQANIKREEAAAMLMRLGSIANISMNTTPLVFNDRNKLHDWSVNAIPYVTGCMDLKGNRVMNGFPSGNFEPESVYSRQQAYATLLRLMNVKYGR